MQAGQETEADTELMDIMNEFESLSISLSEISDQDFEEKIITSNETLTPKNFSDIPEEILPELLPYIYPHFKSEAKMIARYENIEKLSLIGFHHRMERFQQNWVKGKKIQKVSYFKLQDSGKGIKRVNTETAPVLRNVHGMCVRDTFAVSIVETGQDENRIALCNVMQIDKYDGWFLSEIHVSKKCTMFIDVFERLWILEDDALLSVYQVTYSKTVFECLLVKGVDFREIVPSWNRFLCMQINGDISHVVFACQAAGVIVFDNQIDFVIALEHKQVSAVSMSDNVLMIGNLDGSVDYFGLTQHENGPVEAYHARNEKLMHDYVTEKNRKIKMVPQPIQIVERIGTVTNISSPHNWIMHDRDENHKVRLVQNETGTIAGFSTFGILYAAYNSEYHLAISELCSAMPHYSLAPSFFMKLNSRMEEQKKKAFVGKQTLFLGHRFLNQILPDGTLFTINVK